jgi:5'-phosphate synthase pdxT subunit
MIGILALQGDVIEHVNMLASLGAASSLIRYPEHLEGISGLILPGGESTTMTRLIRLAGLDEPLKNFIRSGKPVWGTCAGVILLARGGILESADIEVERNAYGTQLDSFVKPGMFMEKEIPMVFIRAPRILSINEKTCNALSMLDGHIVAAQSKNILISTFHPELTGDTTFIDHFLNLVSNIR